MTFYTADNIVIISALKRATRSSSISHFKTNGYNINKYDERGRFILKYANTGNS